MSFPDFNPLNNTEVLNLAQEIVENDPSGWGWNTEAVCRCAKELIGDGFNEAATTVAQKVSSIFGLFSTHIQRAVQESRTATPKDMTLLVAGVCFGCVGLASGYHCIKKAINGERNPAIGYGTLSAVSFIAGGYAIGNAIINISLRPFCSE